MARTNLYSGSGLASLLTDRDIIPHILKHLVKEERGAIRLLSSDTRAAYDAQAQRLFVACRIGDDVSQRELTIRGILGRGCRPARVRLITGATEQAQKQRLGIRLLRPFADASRSSPMPTPWLCAFTSLLATDTAPHAVAKAFPNISVITLWNDGATNDVFAATLQLLLGTAGGSGGPRPLLPSLTDVNVVMPDLRKENLPNLPPAMAAGLRRATQLRRLHLSFDLPAPAAEPAVAQDLASLVGLESLQIGSVGTPLIRPLVQPLTALTALTFRCHDSLSADVLASLPTGLARLTAAEAYLDVSGLSRLSSLTQLSCEALVAPPGPVAPLVPAAGPRSWALPPRLAHCTLTGQRPEQLPHLMPHAPLCWTVHFTLLGGEHIGEDAVLLPEAEAAALCRAAGTLADSMARGSAVTVQSHPDLGQEGDIWPVGGEAEVGPGRRNHKAWLEALGRTRMSHLHLQGIALSHQDMQAISCMRSVERLHLLRPCSFPHSALPLLARLPALVELSLDVNDWIGGSNMEGPVTVPPHASGALLALCNDGRWPGKALAVKLNHPAGLVETVKNALYDVVEELKRELRLLGVDDKVLTLGPSPA